MSTNFPTSLQDLDATRGTSGQPLSSPNHITHHTTEDDTIEALQAKVGVDNSAVTTSLDYITKNLPVTNIDATGTASSNSYLRGDGAWSAIVPETYSNYHISSVDGAVISTSDVVGAYPQLAGNVLIFQGVGLPVQRRTVTADWAASDYMRSLVLYGNYLYATLHDDATTSFRVYRYDKTNLAAGGTLMTVSGTAFGTNSPGYQSLMVADDSGVFYFTYQAGNSGSQHIISKYTMSGTVFTFVSNTTCGSTSSNFDKILRVDGSGNIYGHNTSVDNYVRKYNSSGTLVSTSDIYTGNLASCLAGNVYLRSSTVGSEVYNRINL